MIREDNNKCKRGLLLLRRYRRPLFHLASSQNCFEDNTQTTRDDQQQAHSDAFWHSVQIFSVLLLPLFVFVVNPMFQHASQNAYGIGLVKGIFISYRKQHHRFCCLISWLQLSVLSLGPSEQSWTDRVCRQCSLKGPSCNPNVSQLGRVIHMGLVTLSPAIMTIWWDWELH